jgi:galactose mutarotase-like enzyme
MVTIENEFLKIKIKRRGAELNSVFNKATALEYMWSGDPAVWGKTSPILFPIVGTLKMDTFLFRNKHYTLPRHGFGRNSDFEITDQKEDSIVFLLKSSSESFEKYPFHFELRVKYHLSNDVLLVTYFVKNLDDETIYFSLGAHPAFKVPLVDGLTYTDHYLEFNQSEDFQRWPISKDGLIETQPVSLDNHSSKIDLSKELFWQDALVFKDLKSNMISLKSHTHKHGLDFSFEGFPYMGIWAAPNADFLCIEPWCGIADSVDHDQQIISKEGIEILSAHQLWSRMWQVRFY